MMQQQNLSTLDIAASCIAGVRLLRQQVVKTFGYISSGPITSNKAYDYDQKVKELLHCVNISYENVETQAKKLPDTMPRKHIADRLIALAGQATIDREASKVYNSLIDSADWSSFQSLYITYVSEFMKNQYAFKRHQMSDFVDRPIPDSTWTLLNNPQKTFEENFAKLPQFPELKSTIQCRYLERNLQSCVIEIKFGYYGDTNKYHNFICSVKLLLIVNDGNIDQIIVADPEEEWRYQDTNRSLLDLSYSSKRKCFRSLTTQANLILANLQPYLVGNQAVNSMKQMLTFFSKFQKLYEQPCALCHKIMSNFMPPTVYDFTNTKIVYHEGCKS
ncbi:Mediator complex, subunit Med27 family-containing protein [Strongyloides ratti]|uniref:Mediator complex, subunit Med27 family-containing protein n=1 Tax=Strongyloides ratti TaxID=34506 RepID=A0A090L1T4_STRRB|nr:Mediator complex, subunit Med27 family-containing protein [Strongyloides ratti]CEF63746.1 Mediator complex, subunit Med27 family-containing protein [Strongyloides ratti]